MTTPTTRVAWFNNELVHHALMQPYRIDDVTRCDLLTACSGYERCVNSFYLYPYDSLITCLACLGSNWEISVEEADRQGRLSKVEHLDTDSVLHRILMEGKAFAPTALRSNRR